MKTDFNDSRFAKFFGSKTNRDYLQTLIDRSDIIKVNYGWWKTQCQKADAPTPIDLATSTATFTQKCYALKSAPMMDVRAPLGKGLQMDVEGIDVYQATIPHFVSPAIVYNSQELMRLQDEFEEFGQDKDIAIQWTQKVQDLIDGAHQTVNYMTAKIQTVGAIAEIPGRGIKIPLQKAKIPTENFVKAGDKVWSDADCKILATMASIEKEKRDEWGYDGALQWKMNYNFFNKIFLQNAEVKELVESYKKNPLAYIASTETAPTTMALFERAFQDYPGVSPIEVEIERERYLTNTGDAMISGWDDKYVVLCPAGKVCDLRYDIPVDEKVFGSGYGAQAIKKLFARMEGGLFTLVNTVSDAGELREWRTELITDLVPALNEFRYHVIVDTSVAG